MKPPGRAFAARLAALHFGLQATWGAILGVSLPVRAAEVGGDAALGGYALTLACGALLAALTQILCGVASDRRFARVGHRREFYLAGVLGALPCLALIYGARTFPELQAGFLGLQIAMNVVGGPYQAAVVDGAPAAARPLAAGWVSAMQSAGAAAGLLAAAFTRGGGTAALLGLALLGSFAATATALGDASVAAAPQAREDAAPIASRALATLGLSRGLANLGFYTLLGFLAFYVGRSLGVADADARRTTTALLFLIFTGGAAVGALAGGRFAARIDPRAVVRAASLAIVGMLCALVLAREPSAAYAAAAAAGVAWGAFAAADWALACAVLPRRALGAAMGLWNLAGVVPQMLAPLCAAPLLAYGDARAYGLGPRLTLGFAALAFAGAAATIYAVPLKSRAYPSAGRSDRAESRPAASFRP